MADLGYSSTPSSGAWTSQQVACQFWITDAFTMPAGGGNVTEFFFYGAYWSGGAQHAITGCIWNSAGTLVWSGATGNLGASQGWVSKSISGLYLPAGNYYVGFWSANPVNVTWEVAPNGTNGGVRFQLVGSPSNQSGGADEYNSGGEGCFGCYFTYTPGGVAHINTGTPASPNWVTGVVSVNTGTPASPVWTPARVRVNTGTPTAPVWTDAT